MVDEAKKEQAAEKETRDDSEDVNDEAEETSEETKVEAEKAEEVPKSGGSAEPIAKEKGKEEPQTQTPAPTKEKKEIKVSAKLADIIKDIENLSVLDLADLVKALEDKFGVSAAAPAAVAPSGTAAASDGEGSADEGQTSFNVILSEGGANKIGVIKAVRELVPSLGLKEAKDLVDAAPKQVLEGVGKDSANEAKKKLEDAGAKVELK